MWVLLGLAIGALIGVPVADFLLALPVRFDRWRHRHEPPGGLVFNVGLGRLHDSFGPVDAPEVGAIRKDARSTAGDLPADDLAPPSGASTDGGERDG